MPSIELLSVNCRSEIQLPKYWTFAWCAEVGTPVGHRGSFDGHLKDFKGFFVHLGNKDLVPGKDKYWTGYELLDLSAVDAERAKDVYPLHICLKSEVASEVKDLANRLLQSSPDGKLLFLTDYQLAEGDDQSYPIKPLTEAKFVAALVGSELEFNTLYEITRCCPD
jgi:hypothetical protein